MQNKLNIHMHSVLSAHGGAARVLNLLANGFLQKGHTVTSSCELEDHNNRLPYKIETAETTAGETATAATKTFPTKILPVQLGELGKGQWRELSQAELNALQVASKAAHVSVSD